jgi:hypothetical protein|tara:strand:- start:353 stop:1132 length:780 start_codon:yes stop_codon:yes gene_type:complete
VTKYVAESGHWYEPTGEPAYTTLSKDGSVRNTTLRDARKRSLLPSVTTIMGVAAKPALENWKVDQGLLAASTLVRGVDEPLESFMSRAKHESKQAGKVAATRGTEIHGEIEQGFRTGSRGKQSVAHTAVVKVLDSLYPDEKWHAERSFASPRGYGGAIDLRSDDVFVDFKTKDNLDPSARAPVYDEHGMQLSAYAEGVGVPAPRRMSLFIDRADPSIVSYYEWSADSHARHLAMFLTLLHYWKLLKKYDPTEEVNDEHS